MKSYIRPDEATSTLIEATKSYERTYGIKVKKKIHQRVLDFLEQIDIDIMNQIGSLERIFGLLNRNGITLLDTSIFKPQFLPINERVYTLTDILYATEVSRLQGMNAGKK